ncbi:hypothetical protein GOV14_03060 [Candidatus Pacearchaeota archaeon]|nr:hypothetical protein [Candidatus Pacearchaeota archaeon]
MILGTKRLLELVEKDKLVENLCERELTNPEGSGFDLRLKAAYRLLPGQAYLGIKTRQTLMSELIGSYGSDRALNIKAGDYFLVRTIETVNLPKDITAFIEPRSTLQRCGIMLAKAKVNPGYSGKLIFGITNMNRNQNFNLGYGARFAHITFFQNSENVSEYRGQWQGGRMSTNGEKEEQV